LAHAVAAALAAVALRNPRRVARFDVGDLAADLAAEFFTRMDSLSGWFESPDAEGGCEGNGLSPYAR
jgi:hypothetical protein